LFVPEPTDARSSSARKLWAETTDLAAIEARMKQLCLGDRASELGRIAWEHIATGGKRLRARLALFAVQALGGRPSDAVGWAASCELLHNASLIHDDIQDGDAFRRGSRALWSRYGTSQAINAGDLCIALGYAAVEEIPVSAEMRFQLTKIVTHSSRRIVEGQAAELGLLSFGVPTWSDYAACVEGKTSALFALPSKAPLSSPVARPPMRRCSPMRVARSVFCSRSKTTSWISSATTAATCAAPISRSRARRPRSSSSTSVSIRTIAIGCSAS
jgi:hypothetical protein